MTKLNEIYRCDVCGNVVSVVGKGAGELVCCGKPMNLLQEKTDDQGMEKHVPVIERIESGTRVKIGSAEHPMQDDHYIEWIEVMSEGRNQRVFLKPGNRPEAEFGKMPGNARARTFCNIHGLWKSK